MTGWVEANFGDSVVNLDRVEVIHRHNTGRAALQMPNGDVWVADEPFEAVMDRVLDREEPEKGSGGD